jgi:protein-tyrosine phosphatase
MRSKTPLLVVTTTAIAAATTTSLASFNNLILISAATAFQFQSSASKSIAMTPMATTIIRPAVAHESCSILLGAKVFRTTSCINNRSNTKLNQYHRGNMHMHMHGQQQQQQQQQQRRCNYSTTTTSLFSSPKFSLFGSVKDGYYDNINNDEIGLDKLLQKAASVRSKWTTKTTATTATTAHSSSPSSSWSSSSLSALINTIGGNDDYCKSNLFFSSSYDASEKTAEFDNSDNNQNQNKSIRGFSNWIIPGKIMVGQYPGRVPEQTTPTIEDTRKHIRNVLFANDIDNNQNNYNNNNNTTICFVSLQSELPPQDDKETWNKNNGEIYLNDDPESMNRKQWPNPFSHYLSEIELVIKQNNDYDEDDETEDEGITTITKQLPPSQVQYIHHPIEDLSVPSNSKNLRLLLWKILNVLDSNHENMVYIHCWGGRGRAGLTACCLLTLLSFANNTDTDTDTDTDDTVNVEMIFDIVQEGYDSRLGSCDMPIGLQRSPQTESQRTFVRKFFEQVVVQKQAS